MELAGTLSAAEDRRGGRAWLNGARWDLTWIVGSAAVVPFALLFVWGGASADLMNLAVTLLIGGPHVFSTFLVTYLDPRFRGRHAVALTLVAVAVVSAVVYFTLAHFQVLLSFFIFAASFHVLQQNAWLADLYRGRAASRDGLASRAIDTALLFLSFYPIASYKLVRDDFMLGDILILIPSLVKSEATYMAVSGLFAAAALLWSIKTVREARRGALNGPKTLLVGLTSLIAFLVPAAASGPRLELAFQTVNAWHSIQYLGIIWLVLATRRRLGPALPPRLAALGGPGRATLRFYATCLGLTLVLMAVVALLLRTDPLGLSTAQYYYMSVFSVLFVHYAWDGYFFLVSARAGTDPDDAPLARLRAPAA
jgi:hypothetical protein